MRPSTRCCVVQAVSMSMGASSPGPRFPPSALARALTVLLGTSQFNLSFILTQPYIVPPCRLDPSIRITYHPRVKKVSQSGFYSKTSNHVYSQQITVFNTKSISVEDVRIIDQVPVSEDEQIKVKLVSPTLTVSPSGGSESASKEKEKEREKAVQKVSVAKGVVAQWDGANEPDDDRDPKALGNNGKIKWVCAVPPQGKVNLVLQWEITAPVSTHIMGL
jgi:hypothetical protein